MQRLAEVGGAFLRLGLISFGGPVAHLGYFRKEFVERRRWLDDEAYADAVALCQFLPGPASSQVAFCLGMRRAGVAGGLAASICFLMPSAVAMILFACAVASTGRILHAGWLHGLMLAAVAVVAQAVWGMGARLCPDWPRRTLAVAAAALVLLFPAPEARLGRSRGARSSRGSSGAEARPRVSRPPDSAAAMRGPAQPSVPSACSS